MTIPPDRARYLARHKLDPCEVCGGTGQCYECRDDPGHVACPVCLGKGVCPECDGDGAAP